MTNPYAMNAFPQAGMYPQTPQQKKSISPGFGSIALLGGITGGAYGYIKNRHPVSKNGKVSDTFVKNVFDKQLKQNASSKSKDFFKQTNTVLKKIDKAKNVDDFKKLVKDNKKIMPQAEAISIDTLLNAVNSTNLKSTKQTLKESLEAVMKFEKLKTENAIRFAWDSETKKFVKKPEFKDAQLFNVISTTGNNIKWKKALKYGGITAGTLGGLTLAYKMFTQKLQ